MAWEIVQMKTQIIFSNSSEVETECLVAVAVDRGENQKTQAVVLGDKAVQNAAADLISSGEVTGKIFETVMLHRPQGLKAKRLLIVGGGKAKRFSAYELRKVAGAAVRFLKPKAIRKFTFAVPEPTPDSVRAVVEGAFVGNFDPDTYKSDRKDQRIEERS